MNEEKKDFSMIDLLNVPVDYGRGYESPISIIRDMTNEIAEMHDNTVYMKIREIVDVDKEELLKALAYDRDQYKKGYREGLEAGKRLAMTTLANSILDEYGRDNE